MQYKKKEISEKILAAGRREYLDKGFRGGNISEIASDAGVPVGNFYRYYDGKMGLLTAIVRPAYIGVPKMINEFALSTSEQDLTAAALTDKMLEIFDKYGTDVLILVDKCATTRYEDFFEKLVDLCDRILLKRLFAGSNDEDNAFFSHTIAATFLTAIFDVLRKGYEREHTARLLSRITAFFFSDIEQRLFPKVSDTREKEDDEENADE